MVNEDIYTNMLIGGILLILALYVIFKLFGNDTISLNGIKLAEEEEILKLLKLNKIENDITLERMEVPRLCKNIYYRIFFTVFSDEDLITGTNEHKIQSNEYLLYEKINDEIEGVIKYKCTISDSGFKIDQLEKIRDKYLVDKKI